MFGKLVTLFNTHEDTFTRTQQQFVEHWKCVAEFLTSNTAATSDVADTKAATHISDMINMIQHDKAPDGADYGPCVEFILQNSVLSTLQQHAQNDLPGGMRRLVLSFFSQLVQKLQISVIPHLNIHQPLQDMITVCGGGKYPLDEIIFLTSVLSKFHEEPSLVDIFMIESSGKNGTTNYELRLVDALISLSHNKNDKVVMKSCEGILMCLAADSEFLIENVLSYTILVQDLVSRLCQRYNIFQAEPSLLLSTHVSWSSQLEQVTGDRELESAVRLLLWLDYINILSSGGHPNFLNKFNKHLSKVFFYTHILNDLMSKEDQFVLKALFMCQKMFRVITSELLFVEVLKFLTDDEVIKVLCSLLNKDNDNVVENTLILFNDMIDTHHSVVIETLVLQYTKSNVNVRARISLCKEEHTSPRKRSVSGDSGVEEMFSDEETSYIHMSTDNKLFPSPESSHLPEASYTEDPESSSSQDLETSSSQDPESSFSQDPDSSHNSPGPQTPQGHSIPLETPDFVDSDSSAPLVPLPSSNTHHQTSDLEQLDLVREGLENFLNQTPNISCLPETSAADIQTNIPTDSDNTDDISNTIDTLPIPELQSEHKSERDHTSSKTNGDITVNVDTSVNLYTSVNVDKPININKENCVNLLNADKSDENKLNREKLSLNKLDETTGNNSMSIRKVSGDCKTIIVSHDFVEDIGKISRDTKKQSRDTRRHSVVSTPSLDVSVDSYLSLMPEFTQPRAVGYAEYLYDAHIRIQEECLTYSWISTQNSELDCDRELTHDMGTFLESILSKVTSIPYQTYKVNMLLISLISEICYIPHYTVTLYFLDTLVTNPVLFTSLQEVAVSFSEILQASPTLYTQLISTNDNETNSDVCKAVYLTEEWCKELAAIALVKST